MSDESARAFVDTNILVYARDGSRKDKHSAAKSLLERLWMDRTGRISIQVCSEYFVTVTRKLSMPMDDYEAWQDVEDLMAWEPVALDEGCLTIGRHVQVRYGLSWWDSLIVAAASRAGCGIIYSEDFNPGQEYLGMTVVNPLR